MNNQNLILLAVILAIPLRFFAADASTPAGERVHALKITILSTMLADGKELGEWGFSALVEADGHRILFDTGAHSDVVLKNAQTLGIDLSTVPDVILSHNHGDHVGGLLTLRQSVVAKTPLALARVHVGEGIFYSRASFNPNIEDNLLILIKPEYEKTGGAFITYEKPKQLFPGVWLTGPIPRKYPEKNWGTRGTVKTPAGVVQDNVPEDQALIIDTDQGLVALLGCGHAGVVNTLDYAQTIVRHAPFYAVIGGFHVFSASDETLKWTAEKLAGFSIENLSGSHCTGIESTYRLRAALGLDRQHAVVTAVGSTFELGKGLNPGVIAK
jgi:7,8-dihydropterin-6-yl-methyl-4-(beta-D-ribofuranosyl)aminobenzene 5'-phosphate synthase